MASTQTPVLLLPLNIGVNNGCNDRMFMIVIISVDSVMESRNQEAENSALHMLIFSLSDVLVKDADVKSSRSSDAPALRV